MADRRAGAKLPKWASREETPGVRVDSGPHLGIVKNNVDPARMGRLQVWIEDLGGDELEPSNWYTVTYASPFFGSTVGLPGSPDTGFGTEQQTYGFWAVPPDLGNTVLITFVMGDPNRGYWFACVPNTPVAHMVPGIARPVDNTRVIADAVNITGRVDADSYLPVTELNTNTVESSNNPDFINSDKSIHSYQAETVLQQGLDTDPLRGTITSSVQRDTPSRVFGFSTPGRTSPDETDFPNFDELIKSGTLSIDQFQSYWITRKGGHTFVMDDGDIKGENNLVRLRTAGGHTILMNDTEDIFYIINKPGTAWIELTKDGSINVYGKNDINIRAGRDLNLHADANVNMHAGDTIRMYGGSSILSQTKIQMQTADDLLNINAGVIGVRSAGNMDIRSISGSWEISGLLNVKSGNLTINTKNELILSSNTNADTGTVSGWRTTTGEIWVKGSKVYINTSGKVVDYPTIPTPPEINPAFDLYKQPNSLYDNEAKRYFSRSDQFESVAPFTPTHEPWARQTGTKKFADGSIEKPTEQGS